MTLDVMVHLISDVATSSGKMTSIYCVPIEKCSRQTFTVLL